MGKVLQTPRMLRRRDKFPSLQRLGMAVEYFARYVNRHERQHSLDVVLLSVIMRGRGRHVMG